MREDDENDIEKFFEALISVEKERTILKLISKGLPEEEALEKLLNESDGGD